MLTRFSPRHLLTTATAPDTPHTASQLLSHQMTCAAWAAKGEKPIRPGSPSRWELEKEQRFFRGSGHRMNGRYGLRSQRVLPSLVTEPVPGSPQGWCTATCLHLLPTPEEAAHSHIHSCPKITLWFHHFPVFQFLVTANHPQSTLRTVLYLPLSLQDPHNLSRICFPVCHHLLV